MQSCLSKTPFNSSPWPGIGVNCQVIFRFLGESTLECIFRESKFAEVVDHCVDMINLGYAVGYVDPPSIPIIQAALVDLRNILLDEQPDVTLEDLITGDPPPTPNVAAASLVLKPLGVFLPYNHIPPDMRYRAISLFNQYGFLETTNQAMPKHVGIGNWFLKDFLTSPASVGVNPTQQAIVARKAKQAGVFRVLGNRFAADEAVKTPGAAELVADGNGKCCAGPGQGCKPVPNGVDPEDYYCESTAPGVNDCNSLSDPCP